MQPRKKGLGWRIWDGYHLLHAGLAAIIAFGGAYIFFSEEGMTWQVDLVTAILMAPLVAIAVLVYKSMFRKKTQVTPQVTDVVSRSRDLIQHARDNAR